jgi:uncharacterized phage protein (TIGR01671 family)
MDRQIKFRGKRVDNGEWVFGSLIVLPDKTLMATESGNNNVLGAFTYLSYLVLPETIGRFTGLYDKNGREIYEGDIIQGKYDLILIKWARTGFLPYRNQNGSFSKVTNWSSVEKGEVIGSVWDNPELLEVPHE